MNQILGQQLAAAGGATASGPCTLVFFQLLGAALKYRQGRCIVGPGEHYWAIPAALWRHSCLVSVAVPRLPLPFHCKRVLKVFTVPTVKCVLLQASPLQCAAIADSCLAMGAATCRAAAAAINTAIQQQQLGPKAAGGKVCCLAMCARSRHCNDLCSRLYACSEVWGAVCAAQFSMLSVLPWGSRH